MTTGTPGDGLGQLEYPLTFVATRTEALNVPYWLLNGPYPLLPAVLPALLALALMRPGGAQAAHLSRPGPRPA